MCQWEFQCFIMHVLTLFCLAKACCKGMLGEIEQHANQTAQQWHKQTSMTVHVFLTMSLKCNHCQFYFNGFQVFEAGNNVLWKFTDIKNCSDEHCLVLLNLWFSLFEKTHCENPLMSHPMLENLFVCETHNDEKYSAKHDDKNMSWQTEKKNNQCMHVCWFFFSKELTSVSIIVVARVCQDAFSWLKSPIGSSENFAICKIVHSNDSKKHSWFSNEKVLNHC